MSCYLRHMKTILEEAGIEPQNKEERKAVDLAIRQATNQKKDEKCNIVWKEVKNWIQNEKKKTRLTNSLKEWNSLPK